MAEETALFPVGDPDSPLTPKRQQRRSFLSRLLRGIFAADNDIQKKLEHISKEEASIHSRLKRRAQSSRKIARNVIFLSVIIEVVAVSYAIASTRSEDLDWKMRSIRVLPMLILPGLSTVMYSSLLSLTRLRDEKRGFHLGKFFEVQDDDIKIVGKMLKYGLPRVGISELCGCRLLIASGSRIVDRKDQKHLERLRAERQETIDELKEKTNYYTTQQLIQVPFLFFTLILLHETLIGYALIETKARYDLDPAAKAAAATVLASKLGADSGLKLQVGDEISDPSGKSHDVELLQSSGLRNRKPSHVIAPNAGSNTTSELIDEAFNEFATNPRISSPKQRVVEPFKASVFSEGSWLSRLAALLVGEDPTQCYALICAHCHMHNGLAKKVDFPYITYYCPHCHGLNGQRHQEEHEMSSSSGKNTPTSLTDSDNTYQSENNTNLTTKNATALVKENLGDASENKYDDATRISGLLNEKTGERELVNPVS
ncbi:hypothetical protein ZIOFF_071331 [Zingiber officinale]|uniref:Lunapark zinc ribbon domain-containing protein n=1 Tax=Zingiber officinale TaxID=94328 RepID=A0A8J5ETI6_ZINOF|nr:hypothetical protein ZIOFF_071331 [Zingiber officinale]